MAEICTSDVVDTCALVNDVLAIGLIVSTALCRISDDSNVLPFRWVPVGVVVALLRALVAVAVTGGILTRVNGRVSIGCNLL